MRKTLSLVLVILLITACNSGIPKNVLPPARMQSVIWDLMRADEMTNFYLDADSSYAGLEKHEALYQQILSIHGISREEFKKSLRYYESNPKYLKTVLDSLQHYADSVQRKKENQPVPVAPSRTDSSLKKDFKMLKKKARLKQVE